VEGKEVPAHKVFLSRCQYFQAMFSNEMLEKRQDKVKIENISYPIFMLILKYIYTDDCDISLEVRATLIG